MKKITGKKPNRLKKDNSAQLQRFVDTAKPVNANKSIEQFDRSFVNLSQSKSDPKASDR